MAARAAVIDHDKVQRFPDTTSGFLKTFQPYLKVDSGCVPFPAVDAAGNVSGGLNPSGTMNGGCSRNLGQIYVKAGHYKGECAVMYSWFFPKEQSVNWPLFTGIGMIGRMSSYGWRVAMVKRRLTRPPTRTVVVTKRRHSRTWMEHIHWSPISRTDSGTTSWARGLVAGRSLQSGGST